MRSRTTLVIVVVAIILVGGIPFGIATTEGQRPDAVPFEDTKTVGLPGSATLQAHGNIVVPRAEAFYSRFRYVVGYQGITPLISEMQTGDSQPLGRVMTVYVSTFSKTKVTLTDEGFLRIPEGRATGWVPAEEAYFVVNSSARVPTQDSTVVPFSTRDDAEAFVGQYGGKVVQWSELRQLPVDRIGHSPQQWTQIVQKRASRTNETVRTARTSLDRSTSVVVGEDAPTVAAAIERAPANTTVMIPAGTYNVENVSVRKPITIRGTGPNKTRLIGDSTGSVIRVFSPKTAVTNLSISGIGPRRTGKNRTNLSIPVDESNRQYTYRKVHGYGDAGIVFDTARRSLVSNVVINTTSNGVIARESPSTTISGLTVYSTRVPRDGFLAVSAIGAGIVVQDSKLYGGKVGVYAYAVSDLVVRQTEMEGMVAGVLDLFSRRNYVSNNTVTDSVFGLKMEGRSYGSAAVDNRIHNTGAAIYLGGTANYVANNTLVQNRAGLQVSGFYSVFIDNVVAYNQVGSRSRALLPTNQVSKNDFVDNARHGRTSEFNTLHLWRGNYWSDAPGKDLNGDGRLDRAFRPTSDVDRRARESVGGRTLANSLALQTLRYLQQHLPGLRTDAIVDPAPFVTPVHENRVRQIRERHNRIGRVDDTDSWNFENGWEDVDTITVNRRLYSRPKPDIPNAVV